MKICIFFLILIFIGVLLLFPTYIEAQKVKRVLAIVGDEVITTLDVEKAIYIIERQIDNSIYSEEFLSNRGLLVHRILDHLIEEKMFEIEAKRQKIFISDEEVESNISRLLSNNNLTRSEFETELLRRGLSITEYRQELRKNILKYYLIERNVKKRVVISDDQVEKVYQNMYHEENINESLVHFRAIFFRLDLNSELLLEQIVKQRAEELRMQVINGSDFAELARKYSQGPGALQGGELGPIPTTDLVLAMRQALIDLKPGDISPVVKIPFGYVFMQLINRGSNLFFSAADAKRQIRIRLENDALEKRLQEWVKILRLKIYIKIIN